MSTKLIEENEVTIDSIYEIFQSAFIKTREIDENKTFIIEFDTLNIRVIVDEERKTLQFFSYYPIEDKSYEETVLGANKANIEKVLARFYIDKEDDSIFWASDYIMSFEMGIIPFQVVHMAKLFERVVASALTEFLESEKNL